MRGDGPFCHLDWYSDGGFSPRAWGWSDDPNGGPYTATVLPTCVGMVRVEFRQFLAMIGSPHVRGDGPLYARKSDRAMMFSPRAWGWSGVVRTLTASSPVLPTCVGMVRTGGRWPGVRGGSPHVRGDGPYSRYVNLAMVGFSPRAWGWSGGPGIQRKRQGVLPTCVGMVRKHGARAGPGARSPHVRGDGPRRGRLSWRRALFSPRAWGWSVVLPHCLPQQAVLPTCVGMVRLCAPLTMTLSGSPHVRGDGPMKITQLCPPSLFSPRAWGWSATIQPY